MQAGTRATDVMFRKEPRNLGIGLVQTVSPTILQVEQNASDATCLALLDMQQFIQTSVQETGYVRTQLAEATCSRTGKHVTGVIQLVRTTQK